MIVSLTSYPARIGEINKVINCLIKQTIMPEKIVLYLAEDQFPKHIVPKTLEQYQQYGFEIHWCDEDIGSYKKFYYAFQEYPDDIIITVDDDFYYKETMIEELMRYYEPFPNAVLARRAHLITRKENGEIASYGNWLQQYDRFVGMPRMDYFATTGGGTLFPPHIFHNEIFNKEIFMKYCSHADDVWVKVMQLLSNVPTVMVNSSFDEKMLEECQDNGLFQHYNYGNKNNQYFKDLLDIYNDYYGKEDTLLSRLAADGIIDAVEERKDAIKDFAQNIIGENEIVLYGAGIIAKRMYNVLKQLGVKKRIKAFVVTNVDENAEKIDGINVRDYRNYVESNVKFLITISQNKSGEVVKDLVEHGIDENRIIVPPKYIYDNLRYIDANGVAI